MAMTLQPTNQCHFIFSVSLGSVFQIFCDNSISFNLCICVSILVWKNIPILPFNMFVFKISLNLKKTFICKMYFHYRNVFTCVNNVFFRNIYMLWFLLFTLSSELILLNISYILFISCYSCL